MYNSLTKSRFLGPVKKKKLIHTVLYLTRLLISFNREREYLKRKKNEYLIIHPPALKMYLKIFTENAVYQLK